MAVVTGYDIGKRVCEILGLACGVVKSVSIHIRANDAVMVDVEQYMNKDQWGEFESFLTSYSLYPAPDHYYRIAEQWLQRVREGRQ